VKSTKKINILLELGENVRYVGFGAKQVLHAFVFTRHVGFDVHYKVLNDGDAQQIEIL
tara:strand:- start:6237 stop:6410 length:174 start_codon:yes stop_codon:yes gene_type:complete